MVATILSAILFGQVNGPPGKLFLFGGGVVPDGLYERFFAANGGRDALIAVLPQTGESGEATRRTLQSHGAKNVAILDSPKPSAYALKKFAERLSVAKGIWIPGGDQGLFMRRFERTWLDENVKRAISQGANFFGASGGAMLASDPMIAGQDGSGNPNLGPGLGLTNWVVETHYRERKRQPRLRQATQTLKRNGVGLSEGEWVVIQADKPLEKSGSPEMLESDDR